MRQFQRYPIYVNHPGRWEEIRQRQLEEFKAKRDRRMVNWLRYTGKRLFEITQYTPQSLESQTYENAVLQQLSLIATTTIGRLLLSCLDQHNRYYIVPLDLLDKSECACAAYTFPGKPNEGGGIRIYYNPSDFNSSERKWKSADDILFHELVHAYRNGRFGYDVVNQARTMNENKDAEEFFALHMQNVYLGCRGAQRYYRTYNRLESVSKDTCYSYFAGDAEVLMAFRYFVEQDPLAGTVAKWMTPATSFNPFRDQNVLERMYISSASLQITRLPPF
jgi:hypothetical protein